MNKLLKSSFEYYRKSIKWQLLVVGDSQKNKKKKKTNKKYNLFSSKESFIF